LAEHCSEEHSLAGSWEGSLKALRSVVDILELAEHMLALVQEEGPMPELAGAQLPAAGEAKSVYPESA
jgi:hypothetical protein